ncbi:MAG TPA: glucokinase, partial [Hansschlegelia sp.]
DDASSPEITAAAIAGEPMAAETIGQFLVLLARFSGDVALAFGARGGVYLCGGIMPRLVGLVDADAFRAGFETKRPHEAMLRQIATVVVSSDVSGLVGCAAVARAR